MTSNCFPDSTLRCPRAQPFRCRFHATKAVDTCREAHQTLVPTAFTTARIGTCFGHVGDTNPAPDQPSPPPDPHRGASQGGVSFPNGRRAQVSKSTNSLWPSSGDVIGNPPPSSGLPSTPRHGRGASRRTPPRTAMAYCPRRMRLPLRHPPSDGFQTNPAQRPNHARAERLHDGHIQLWRNSSSTHLDRAWMSGMVRPNHPPMSGHCTFGRARFGREPLFARWTGGRIVHRPAVGAKTLTRRRGASSLIACRRRSPPGESMEACPHGFWSPRFPIQQRTCAIGAPCPASLHPHWPSPHIEIPSVGRLHATSLEIAHVAGGNAAPRTLAVAAIRQWNMPIGRPPGFLATKLRRT